MRVRWNFTCRSLQNPRIGAILSKSISVWDNKRRCCWLLVHVLLFRNPWNSVCYFFDGCRLCCWWRQRYGQASIWLMPTASDSALLFYSCGKIICRELDRETSWDCYVWTSIWLGRWVREISSLSRQVNFLIDFLDSPKMGYTFQMVGAV